MSYETIFGVLPGDLGNYTAVVDIWGSRDDRQGVVEKIETTRGILPISMAERLLNLDALVDWAIELDEYGCNKLPGMSADVGTEFNL